LIYIEVLEATLPVGIEIQQMSFKLFPNKNKEEACK